MYPTNKSPAQAEKQIVNKKIISVEEKMVFEMSIPDQIAVIAKIINNKIRKTIVSVFMLFDSLRS